MIALRVGIFHQYWQHSIDYGRLSGSGREAVARLWHTNGQQAARQPHRLRRMKSDPFTDFDTSFCSFSPLLFVIFRTGEPGGCDCSARTGILRYFINMEQTHWR